MNFSVIWFPLKKLDYFFHIYFTQWFYIFMNSIPSHSPSVSTHPDINLKHLLPAPCLMMVKDYAEKSSVLTDIGHKCCGGIRRRPRILRQRTSKIRNTSSTAYWSLSSSSLSSLSGSSLPIFILICESRHHDHLFLGSSLSCLFSGVFSQRKPFSDWEL